MMVGDLQVGDAFRFNRLFFEVSRFGGSRAYCYEMEEVRCGRWWEDDELVLRRVNAQELWITSNRMVELVLANDVDEVPL